MSLTNPPTPARRYWEPRINTREEPMRRRHLIVVAIRATGAGLVPGVLSPAAVAAPDRLAGSTSLAATLADLSGDIWRTGAAYVNPQAPAARADLLDVAQWQWAQAVGAATRTSRHPLHQRALSIEAEASRQLAMMYADRAHHAAASRLYRYAAAAAEHAGDHEMVAWVQASYAYMPLYGGAYHRSIELASQALTALDRAQRPGGRAKACAHALLARSYAACGDAANADRALALAYGAMARYGDAGSSQLPAAHHPQRFAWVKLRLAAAETYAALGSATAHRQAYDAALADRSVSAMHLPMLRLGRAEVTHDPAAACREALTVLRAMPTPPTPVVGRARALAQRATAKDPRSNDVQALRVHLLKLPR